MKTAAIIVAAGRGNRMGADISKQFLTIGSLPILARCIQKFNSCQLVDEIILVTSHEYIDYCQTEIVGRFHLEKVKRIVEGGSYRQQSVKNGLFALHKNTDIVLIHDGVRPFVSIEEIELSIQFAQKKGCCVLGTPVKDTIKIADTNKQILSTPDRSTLWAIQTPQTFPYPMILKAHEKAEQERFIGTDDASLMEWMGEKVFIIKGSYENIKITTPEDLIIGEAITKRQEIN